MRLCNRRSDRRALCGVRGNVGQGKGGWVGIVLNKFCECLDSNACIVGLRDISMTDTKLGLFV